MEDIDRVNRYDLPEAVKMALGKSYAKFDETVDVAINLGVNPKYADQMVRGAVTLPHGLGKEVRVAAFCMGDKEAEAKEAGADYVGGEDLVEKVKGGWLEFDKAVATPDMMAKVGQIGKILGPRGLMPNAKTGTVTFDIGNAVRELKAGKVEFKVDKAGVLHAPLGKVSFGEEKITDNLRTLVDTVISMKPSSSKGTYLRAMALSTTMGPGIKVDTLSVQKYLEG
jgi:large subunit ribosomal protein L1